MKKANNILFLFLIIVSGLTVSNCRDIELVVPTEYEILPIGEDINANPEGMYLLNEGNMGSNKASIDFLDYRTGLYARNIYAEINPTIVKELGDVGNDIQIYRGKLFAVINCSHKVEVMDAATGKRIGQIDIPNCRYIRFHKNYAYVSAYVAPVSMNPDAQKGAVYKVDVNTLEIVSKVVVGYQPDELEIVGEYIYVANSGGYRAPNYDNTVSVIEIEAFRQIQQIPVGINLSRIKADKYGKLWVTSRGDNKTIPANLYVLQKINPNSNNYTVTDTLNIPCSEMAIDGDSIFFYSVEWSYNTNENNVSYGIIDVKTKKQVSNSFIKDGTETNIKVPYGIAIHPVSKEIFVTDAKNYVSSGVLHCYSKTGIKQWSVRTGDIPAHMVFLTKENSTE